MSLSTSDVETIAARLHGALERVQVLERELVEVLELVDPEPVLPDEEPEPQLRPFEEEAGKA